MHVPKYLNFYNMTTISLKTAKLITEVKNSIAQADLEKALDLMEELFPDDANSIIALKSRFNAHKKDVGRGIISREQESLQYNRILDSINFTLSNLAKNRYNVEFSRESRESITPISPIATHSKTSASEAWQDVIYDLKARCRKIIKSRESTADQIAEAEKIYTSLSSYADRRDLNESHDLFGDALKALTERVRSLETQMSSTAISNITQLYTELLEVMSRSRLPEWEDLKNVYSKLRNTGRKDRDCEGWFFPVTGTAPEPDDTLRIRAATIIDQMLVDMQQILRKN